MTSRIEFPNENLWRSMWSEEVISNVVLIKTTERQVESEGQVAREVETVLVACKKDVGCRLIIVKFQLEWKRSN